MLAGRQADDRYTLSVFQLLGQRIDQWERNQALARRCLYGRDRLGIDPEKSNVNGGPIATGHPQEMSGTRMTGHAGVNDGLVRSLGESPLLSR